jgi:hypothetical protein
MLIKIHYSNGFSCCVDSAFLSSVSFAEYLTSQFQFDEYGLPCDSIEIMFTKDLVKSSANPVKEDTNVEQLVAA